MQRLLLTLLVLGRVVVGVLAEVAVSVCRGDVLDDPLPVVALEESQFLLELLERLLSQWDLLGVVTHAPRLVPCRITSISFGYVEHLVPWLNDSTADQR